MRAIKALPKKKDKRKKKRSDMMGDAVAKNGDVNGRKTRHLRNYTYMSADLFST